jgi:hypothetical protein
MKKNIGTIDKVIRIVFAIAVITLFLTNIISGVLGVVLIAVSAILVITSMLGVCPLYMILGLNTAEKTVNRKVQ